MATSPTAAAKTERLLNLVICLLATRRFLTAATLGASTVALSGCDAFDFLQDRDSSVRNFLTGANDLTYHAQRLIAGRNSLAQEFTEADIRQPQRPNGITAPNDDVYLGLQSNDFAGSDRLSQTHGDVPGPQPMSRTCKPGFRCLSKKFACRPAKRRTMKSTATLE